MVTSWVVDGKALSIALPALNWDNKLLKQDLDTFVLSVYLTISPNCVHSAETAGQRLTSEILWHLLRLCGQDRLSDWRTTHHLRRANPCTCASTCPPWMPSRKHVSCGFVIHKLAGGQNSNQLLETDVSSQMSYCNNWRHEHVACRALEMCYGCMSIYMCFFRHQNEFCLSPRTRWTPNRHV